LWEGTNDSADHRHQRDCSLHPAANTTDGKVTQRRPLSTSGRPQYTTRHTFVIENNGTAPAEDLSFAFESDVGDNEPPTTFGNEEPVKRLAQGGSLTYPLAVSMGTADQFDVVMQWREGDTSRNERQTLRV
jgi:hypothetical protein